MDAWALYQTPPSAGARVRHLHAIEVNNRAANFAWPARSKAARGPEQQAARAVCKLDRDTGELLMTYNSLDEALRCVAATTGCVTAADQGPEAHARAPGCKKLFQPCAW